MSSLLLELGGRAVARLPEDAQEQARMHLFDALAAALAGAATREGGNSGRHSRSLAGDCGVPDPAGTVLALARRIRATELDDLQLESVTTAAAAVVPALLGAAAVAGQDARGADEALGALAAGYDVMFTLGLAAGGPDFLYGQGGWPSLVGAGPAAAATAGRLLGLDAVGIAHAIALVLQSTPRIMRGSGEDGRWLSFGLAVTAGFHAALAARAGARGDTGLLDAVGAASSGTASTAPGTGVGGGLFAGLGAALARPWLPGTGLARAHLKRWASAGQVAAAIDAVGQLQDAHGFTADDVLAIGVYVPSAYRPMIDQPTGAGRLWSLLSAHYQIAVRLHCPRDLFDCARPVLRGSPGFLRTMRAVRVHDADSLAARHPQSYPARVEVTLAGGTVVDCLSDGRSPSPDWDWDSVLDKARAVAAHTGTEAAIDGLYAATAHFANSEELFRLAQSLLGFPY
jgi:2-methylcitrate dehydratase PrpD